MGGVYTAYCFVTMQCRGSMRSGSEKDMAYLDCVIRRGGSVEPAEGFSGSAAPNCARLAVGSAAPLLPFEELLPALARAIAASSMEGLLGDPPILERRMEEGIDDNSFYSRRM